MSYNPTTDFMGLLRLVGSGVRSERMPGLDYVVAALARAGLINLVVAQTAPTASQSTTVWFQPAIPSWTAEGTVWLWNSTAAAYQVATPILWSALISGVFPGNNLPIVDGVAFAGASVAYSRQDHVHPTDTSRAPIASPVFTGAPQAPTPTFGDNSNNLATTAFVQETSGASQNIPQPQGYLTLTSGVPIITGDVTAATALYYTPYAGAICPVYNGAVMVGEAFTEQTLTLESANHLASTIYDVFAFVSGGGFTIGTGVAWASSAAGSSSRGAGAGTTQLQRVDGFLTNEFLMTMRNGLTTYAVGANGGTYLGSIFIDVTAGQVSCYRSYGQSRKWGVWNAYNRAPIALQAGDPTASWGGTGTLGPSNASSANSISIFTGLAEELIDARFNQTASWSVTPSQASSSVSLTIGIGWNSTTAASGKKGNFSNAWNLTNSTQNTLSGNESELVAEYLNAPVLGLNTVTALNISSVGAAATILFFGTQANMLLSSFYRG